ncbi:MAG: sigma-70 family RNA polymerase sigma factor [Muribaculaceae bacterium]|nr:sigma-70 family RNA polymerase sigma factor [Muribaculaceae bacterium]
MLFKIAYSVLGNEADAGDAVQEVMTKIWSIDADLDDINNPLAYASRILRTTAIDLLRKRRYDSPADPVEIPLPDMVSDPDAVDSAEFIRCAIDSLPPGQQEVMRLSAYSGLPTDEIALATGFTQDNVRQLLSRARKRLRTIFKTA